MPPIRTVYVPRFGSQLTSSQTDEPQPDQTTNQTTNRTTKSPSRCRRDKSGNKRAEKTRFLLKLKLTKRNILSKTKQDKTPRILVVEPDASTTKTAGSGGGTGPDPDSDSVDRDGFFFSQRPTSVAVNEKEKAKHAVLRTISRMLEENQLIRQRLVTISQTN